MTLPADGHVHSQWSWDASAGAMEQTCARAVELGLPAIAFTEHFDFTPWIVIEGELDDHPHLQRLVTDGQVEPPAFDADGYLASVERCRDLFPDLRIITGVEVGEPHWYPEQIAALLASGRFERVLGSLHCLPLGDRFSEMVNLYRERPADQVIRDYLAEIPRMVSSSDAFGVLAHIDYAVRYWPADAHPFDPCAFEDEFRGALSALAATGRALEVNTRGPMHPEIVRWWREQGGDAVTFGSDAHRPENLGHRFAEAVAMVEAHGYRPGRHPYDVWFG